MKRASSRFFVLFLSMLFVSLQSYGQGPGERRADRREQRRNIPEGRIEAHGNNQYVLEQVVHLSLLPHNRVHLAEALNISSSEVQNFEILSLSVTAQSYDGPAVLHLNSYGRHVQAFNINRNLRSVETPLAGDLPLSSLELVAAGNIYIQSISLQVRQRNSYPGGFDRQVEPHSVLRLMVNRHIRSHGEIPLKRLIKEQLGKNISGAQILRVTIEGQAMAHQEATLQVEINNRPVGRPKSLRPRQGRALLQVDSYERIQTLRLNVYGDAYIQNIIINVGDVESQPHGPEAPQYPSRLSVNQEVAPYRALYLAGLLPHERRLVRSITVEASPRYGSVELALVSPMSYPARVTVTPYARRQVIFLSQPVELQSLRIESNGMALIETLEIDFLNSPY